MRGRTPKSDATRIAERWERFRPWAIIAARQGVMLSAAVDYAALLEAERCRHERLCHRLLAAGLTWQTIDLRSLDDPKMNEVERAERIAVSIKATRAHWKQRKFRTVAAIGARMQ